MKETKKTTLKTETRKKNEKNSKVTKHLKSENFVPQKQLCSECDELTDKGR